MDYYNMEYVNFTTTLPELSFKEIAPILLIMGSLSTIVVVRELFKIVFYNEYDNLEGDIEHLRVNLTQQIEDLTNRVQQLEMRANELPTEDQSEEEETESIGPPTEVVQQQETQQQETQQQETQQQETQAQTPQKNDNYAAVIKHLLNRDVYVSYKGKTVAGVIKAKPASKHGFVVVSEEEEFDSLTGFSTSKKRAINPSLESDNGWDSVYIVTGVNAKGKPTKKSIRKAIADAA